MRALITCLVLANGLLQSAAIAGDLRIGIVGVDTSHAIAFTKIFQQSHGDGPLRGMKVVAAYPHGSWDIPSSASRIPKNTKRIADLGVKIVGSVDELVEAVDAILLETNDGRPHLEQLLPIFRARKPVFVDKPIAARLSDVLAIYELAEQTQTPLFTSSALRFTPKTQEIRNGSLGTVQKADVFSPATLEPTHSDLFWYGIHGVEPLFTVMGTGCERVRNTSTPDQDVVVGEWKGNRTGTFRGRRKGGGYGGTVFGSKSSSPTGGYVGYAPLVEAIAKFFRTRTPPVPAAESIEIYAFMTAAEESRRRSGASVTLKEVLDKARGKYLTADGAVFDTGFSSAGARFLSVKGNTVRLAPDLRDTEGWWFWWNFRVRGAAGKTFRFEFDDRSPIGPYGPAVSRDHGKTWTWLGARAVKNSAFEYHFRDDESAVRFAFAPPYGDAELRRFLDRLESLRPKRPIEKRALATSERHRVVRSFHFGSASAKHNVILTARHHACETMASYVLEGLAEEAISDSECGKWLTQHARFTFVPIVDVDGVEQGDQGKNRKPHDHNRDYADRSIYSAIRAIIEERSKTQGETVSLDLHCPYLRGGRNETAFLVATPGENQKRETDRFAAILETARRGPIPFSAGDVLPWGAEWNTKSNRLEHSSSHWMSRQKGARLATTLEFPYSNARGVVVTPEAARAFGRDLARALKVYLSTASK